MLKFVGLCVCANFGTYANKRQKLDLEVCKLRCKLCIIRLNFVVSEQKFWQIAVIFVILKQAFKNVHFVRNEYI